MADPLPTVSVATGLSDVTGVATNFIAAENDLFCLRGQAIPIASRPSPTQIILKQPWPLASVVNEQSFSILSLGDYWRSAIPLNERFAKLLAKWEIVSPFRFDAAGSLAERDNYNNQPRNFVYFATEPLPARIFIKLANTNSSADWSGAFYFGSGGQVEYQEALDEERQQRVDADAAISGQVTAEVSRAQGVEGGLRTDLTTVVGRATALEGRATGVESRVGAVETANAKEITDRVQGDAANSIKIDNEETRASAAESSLGGRIDSETTARSNADATLTATKADKTQTVAVSGVLKAISNVLGTLSLHVQPATFEQIEFGTDNEAVVTALGLAHALLKYVANIDQVTVAGALLADDPNMGSLSLRVQIANDLQIEFGTDNVAVVTPRGLAHGLLPYDTAAVVAQKLVQALAAYLPRADLNGLSFKVLPPESGFSLAFGHEGQGAGLALRNDNTLVAVELETAGGAIRSLPPESGFLFNIGGTNRQSPIAVDLAGLTWLRLNPVSQPRETVAVRPDAWRATYAPVSTRTSANGALYAAFPHLPTLGLRGTNRSGVDLQFRRSRRLPLRGRRYRGAWSPGSVASIAYKGVITNGQSVPAGTYILGDYFVYGDPASGTAGGVALTPGDVLTYNGSAWVAQPSPAGGVQPEPGDWWTVTASGTFDGVPYVGGTDRIIWLTREAMAGPGRYRWLKGSYADGTLFYRGPFAPASGLPAAFLDRDVWQASAAGTAGGMTFEEGDYLLREDGAWGLITNEPARTVAAGTLVHLPCVASADEWEVRRADLSATRVGVSLNARQQVAPTRSLDDVLMLSDSMFGVGSTGDKTIALLGRVGFTGTYGGGTSREVLGMLETSIASGGDAYQARVIVFWHGQNNPPGVSGDVNTVQIQECSLHAANLVGARDGRILFLSVLGYRQATYDSGVGRLVYPVYEGIRAAGINGATDPFLDLERWYAVAFPGRWMSPRLALLAAASSTLPEPVFPGLTERQVANQYGIPPSRFFRALNGESPIPVTSLVFRGYRTTAGLPTGGASGDYYLRGGGATPVDVGNLIINESGTWVERPRDPVHLSDVGGDVNAAAIVASLVSLNW